MSASAQTCAKRGLIMALAVCGISSAADLELDEYLQRATAARNRGDWESVASQIAQALNHSDLPKSGSERSAVHVEYGRAMGVLCDYAEAEKYLQLGKEIAEKAGGPPSIALYELGAVSVAQKKYQAAAQYFAQFETAVARESGGKTSPAIIADANEKLAVALDAMGKTEEAGARRSAAAKGREKHPKPAPGAITPYGTKCR